MIAGELALVAAAFLRAQHSISTLPSSQRVSSSITARCLLSGRRLISEALRCKRRSRLSVFLLALIAAWQTGRVAFVVGSCFMLANWPWTVFRMFPIRDGHDS